MQVWRRASQCHVVEDKGLRVRGSRVELAYLGSVVVIEFEGYGSLMEVSKRCLKGRGGCGTIVVSRTTFVAIGEPKFLAT